MNTSSTAALDDAEATLKSGYPVTTVNLAADITDDAEHLLATIKAGVDDITLAESRTLFRTLLDAEGFLRSCRTLLVPPGVI